MTNKKEEENNIKKEASLEIFKDVKNDFGKIENSETAYMIKEAVKKRKNVLIGTLNVFINPIKRRHVKHYKESKFHLVADILMMLVIIGLSVLWYFFSAYNPKQEVEISGQFADEKIVSGKVAKFEINYQTKNKDILNSSNITVDLPNDFIVTEVSPANIFNQNTNTFNIGDLHNGSNGKISIYGKIIGDVGSQHNISYVFNYLKKGKNASILNTTLFAIDGSVLNVDIKAPESAYINSDFNLEVLINTEVENSISEAVIKLENENLKLVDVQSINSSAELRDGLIFVKNISKNDCVVLLKVNFADDKDGKIRFKTFTADNNYYQGEVVKEIVIKKSSLDVVVKAKNDILIAGESIKYSLEILNNNDCDVKNLEIDFKPTDADFYISDVSVNGKLLKGDRFTLDEIIPRNDNKNYNLEVMFKRKKPSINKELGLILTSKYSVNGNVIEKVYYSNQLKVASDVRVFGKGLYYASQGDQLGSGPIPPRVDMITNYWVFFEINNFGNNLKDFVLTGDFSRGVIWNNNKTVLAGNLKYGEETKIGVWSIDEIKDSGGVYKVGFEIGIVPEAADEGKIMNLVSNIEYRAYDTYCEKELVGRINNIDTNLENDILSAGRGLVVK